MRYWLHPSFITANSQSGKQRRRWRQPASKSGRSTDGSRCGGSTSVADWLERVRWNVDGLVPAIAQDAATHRVLTLAWMNREALTKTVKTQLAHYWSRSRAKLWRKGERSGHTQRIREIRMDCDSDAILLIVE